MSKVSSTIIESYPIAEAKVGLLIRIGDTTINAEKYSDTHGSVTWETQQSPDTFMRIARLVFTLNVTLDLTLSDGSEINVTEIPDDFHEIDIVSTADQTQNTIVIWQRSLKEREEFEAGIVFKKHFDGTSVFSLLTLTGVDNIGAYTHEIQPGVTNYFNSGDEAQTTA